MNAFDWIFFGLGLFAAIDVLIVALLVRNEDARNQRKQENREIPPFPYASALRRPGAPVRIFIEPTERDGGPDPEQLAALVRRRLQDDARRAA